MLPQEFLAACLMPAISVLVKMGSLQALQDSAIKYNHAAAKHIRSPSCVSMGASVAAADPMLSAFVHLQKANRVCKTACCIL